MTTETKPKELTPAELMGLIAAAGASGDLAEVIRLGNLLKKHQGEIQKAEAERLQKESEAMAGDRAKLADILLTQLRKQPLNLFAKLDVLKATGFTYKIASKDQNGVETKDSVALTVPTIKTAKIGGGGGGNTGILKAQTGMSRQELIDKYATEEEKSAITKAETDAVTRKDSARYTAQKPVIKRILASNPELIRK